MARALCLFFILLGLGVGAQALAQQDYPSRPIRLITPAAQGGTTDLLARVFGARLAEVFKQQVVVDNRAGAAGVIAGELTRMRRQTDIRCCSLTTSTRSTRR